MIKVPKNNLNACNYIHATVTNTNFIADLFHDQLLLVQERCRLYDWNGFLLTFIIIDRGDLNLIQLYRGF